MIKVNSKVVITESGDIPMIVEGLYYRAVHGIKTNINHTEAKVKPEYAKCIWYNTRNELQSELINLELLTEL